jgi:lysophospholipase L1-like esterase
MASVMLVLGISAATACNQPAQSQVPPSAHTNQVVVIFGDSIWEWSMSTVKGVWKPAGYPILDYTKSGTGLLVPDVDIPGQTAQQEWHDTVSSTLSFTVNATVVVDFGHNDCVKAGGVPPNYGQDIANFIAAVPSDLQLNYMTVRSIPTLPGCAEEVNRLWRVALAARSHSSIWDYATAFEGHPEWYAPDGVHPNGEGARQLANWTLGLLVAPPVQATAPPTTSTTVQATTSTTTS